MIVGIKCGKGIEYYRIITSVRTRSIVGLNGEIMHDRTWISGAGYTKVSNAEVDVARRANEVVLLLADGQTATLPDLGGAEYRGVI